MVKILYPGNKEKIGYLQNFLPPGGLFTTCSNCEAYLCITESDHDNLKFGVRMIAEEAKEYYHLDILAHEHKDEDVLFFTCPACRFENIVPTEGIDLKHIRKTTKCM